jgi:hypothetical protein
MVELMRLGDWLLQRDALPYFRKFPSAEAGPCIVAFFEDPEAVFDEVVTEAAEIDDDTLGAVIRATFGKRPVGLGPYAKSIWLVANSKTASPGVLGRLQDIGYPVEAVPEYRIDDRICDVHSVQRLTDDQVLLQETFNDTVWGFLVVRKDKNWVVAKRERLRILCW